VKDSWAVIGAGPAGIAAVSQLINRGIDPNQIIWIDPAFQVGDFGTQWRCVSSNTKIKFFLSYYARCPVFNTATRPVFAIEKQDPESTCLLALAAEPLQWITQQLMQQVRCIKQVVTQVEKEDDAWRIDFQFPASQNSSLRAHAFCGRGNPEVSPGSPRLSASQPRDDDSGGSCDDDKESCVVNHVILAIGSLPKWLHHAGVNRIPLETALDINQLQHAVTPSDCVAVFGASHSAILVIKDLLELNVNVINFYQSTPLLKYAIYHNGWIENDNTGLKGNTAEWARTHLDPDKALPSHLTRVSASSENLATFLPRCNKAIYAIGFKRRLLSVAGLPVDFAYDDQTGVIAPGLFGVGIAFPRMIEDRVGNKEHRVGIWKFMEDIQHFLPKW
jgi:hypothetical protein